MASVTIGKRSDKPKKGFLDRVTKGYKAIETALKTHMKPRSRHCVFKMKLKGPQVRTGL